MKKIIITIDGPAASGKEKIAKYISKKWKLKHLDSGVLYRRLALNFVNNNVDVSNVNQIKKKLNENDNISFRNTLRIRTQKISQLASEIATHNCVKFL